MRTQSAGEYPREVSGNDPVGICPPALEWLANRLNGMAQGKSEFVQMKFPCVMITTHSVLCISWLCTHSTNYTSKINI